MRKYKLFKVSIQYKPMITLKKQIWVTKWILLAEIFIYLCKVGRAVHLKICIYKFIYCKSFKSIYNEKNLYCDIYKESNRNSDLGCCRAQDCRRQGTRRLRGLLYWAGCLRLERGEGQALLPYATSWIFVPWDVRLFQMSYFSYNIKSEGKNVLNNE